MADKDKTDEKVDEEAKKKSKKEEEEEQEKKNKALREKFQLEVENFEQTSNETLDHVREKGVSIDSTDAKKKLPEQISDIHILFSRQKPEFVFEGVDTSDELRKEIEGEDDDEEESD